MGTAPISRQLVTVPVTHKHFIFNLPSLDTSPKQTLLLLLRLPTYRRFNCVTHFSCDDIIKYICTIKLNLGFLNIHSLFTYCLLVWFLALFKVSLKILSLCGRGHWTNKFLWRPVCMINTVQFSTSYIKYSVYISNIKPFKSNWLIAFGI